MRGCAPGSDRRLATLRRSVGAVINGHRDGREPMAPEPRDREGKPLDAYGAYDADSPANIVILPYHVCIRRRPVMYLGSVDIRGLHELVEIRLSEPLEQARAGAVRQIDVELRGDGGCRVSDDGPGLPVERHPQEDNRTAGELRLTNVGFGGGGRPAPSHPPIHA